VECKDNNRKRKAFVAETNSLKQHKPAMLVRDLAEMSEFDNVSNNETQGIRLATTEEAIEEECDAIMGDETAHLKRKASRDMEVCGMKRKASQTADLF